MMTPAVMRWIHPEAWPETSFKLPKLQAHRGYWAGGFQENTMEAFRAAKVAGFQMCEMDVRLSKDGIPVVFHDPDLGRLGSSRSLVQTLTARELFLQAKAPTLQSILSDAAVPEFFNIELKTTLGEIGRLEPAVAKVIRECRAEKRVMFSSFNPLSLTAMAQTLPQIPRALLATQQKGQGNHFIFRNLLLAPFLRIHMLNLDRMMLNRKVAQELKRRDIPFTVWTVNEPMEAQMFLDAGAASVITDRVTKIFEE